MAHRIKRPTTPTSTDPRPATACASATPGWLLEVESDATTYGDECKFGGGKVLRDGMGQAAGVGDAQALDCVITNALIVDWTGVRKADVGIKTGASPASARPATPT